MKNLTKGLLVAAALFLTALPSHAEVGFGIYWGRPWYHRHWHPWSPVIAPVVVEHPVVYAPPVEEPVYVPDPVATRQAHSERLEVQLARFHERLYGHRRLLDRQLAQNGIAQWRYDRDVQALNLISDDERRWSVDNNGCLSEDQLQELSRRLRDVSEQIQADLAA